ncbi:hypothetical protein VNO77_13415 [Canavalia gladiata]|uniref:Protein kinase domain-containing protein n=1 Tax=Canavalia gladiata TaxID=3824 RepID=A0AAN9QQ91_CANGL
MGREVILVAVDASKEISSDHALEWTVQNVIKAEDILILLAILPSCERPTPILYQRIQSLACNFLRCGTRKIEGRSTFDQVDQSKRDISRKINYLYAHKMQKLWLANNLIPVHYQVKVILDASLGSVSTKAKELRASWVILDRFLNKEADHCIKQLNCNVVLIGHAIPRILKTVNPLGGEEFSESRRNMEPTERNSVHMVPNILDYKSVTTPSTSDIRSSTLGTYSFSLPSTDKEYQCKISPCTINDSHTFLHLNFDYFDDDVKYLEAFSLSPSEIKYRQLNKISSGSNDELNLEAAERKHHFERTDNLARRLTDSSCIWREQDSPIQQKKPKNRRDSMTYSHQNSIIESHSVLCSMCMNKTPIFRSVPRRFTFREIENATGGFSDCNLMTEGGNDCVYRGELPDGQIIAVKQCKKLKAFAALDFCLEVETLSCAQNRNLLRLVGYCIDTEWLLIYEFACNGSLDKHLYEAEEEAEVKVVEEEEEEEDEEMSKSANRTGVAEILHSTAWNAKFAYVLGTARGLRYLHEDCRAGCIIHRDLRPSNILLTHDFEPMIGDFGLARWQLNAQLAKDTHLIGTFGYLAPEYIQTGQVSEKGDVYAFGVILLEILSGFKAMEFSGKTSNQSLSEWGNTMLEKKKLNELIDYRLHNNYVKREAESMMHAAYLCISPQPEQRPRMSQVLKILEGDLPCASMYQSSKSSNKGSVE